MTCKDCYHYDVCMDYTTLKNSTAAQNFNGSDIACDYFKDKSRIVELPRKGGTHLWKVTYPYRAEPKVTEFVVKNFKTVGKKHRIQIEVQAVNVPGTNWMYFKDFYESREEAEEALRKAVEK